MEDYTLLIEEYWQISGNTIVLIRNGII